MPPPDGMELRSLAELLDKACQFISASLPYTLRIVNKRTSGFSTIHWTLFHLRR